MEEDLAHDEVLQELQKRHPDVESSRLQAVVEEARRISPKGDKEYLLQLTETLLPNYLAVPLITLPKKGGSKKDL